MTEKIQVPFAALKALQQEAEDTWGKVHGSCLHGPRELHVLRESIDAQLKKAREHETATGANNVTKAATECLQSAYNECSYQFICRWVEDITTRVIDLRYVAPSLPHNTLIKKIRSIRETILELREHHTLDTENRKYLRLAETLLQQLEQGKNEPRPKVRKPSDKLVTVDFAPISFHPINPQLAETLCEIAHLFYSDRTNEGYELLKTLSENEQEEIKQLAASVGGTINQLFDIQDEDAFLNASIAFSRACMARSNFYADNGEGMPNEEGISILFDESLE